MRVHYETLKAWKSDYSWPIRLLSHF